MTKIQETLLNVFEKTTDLYWKTHSYHWNYLGPDFYQIHKMLDEQYNNLWSALDQIAERMRVQNLPAPVKLPQSEAKAKQRQDILNDLLNLQEEIIITLKSSIETLTKENDPAGTDFLTGRLAEHEKMAWMIKASI